MTDLFSMSTIGVVAAMAKPVDMYRHMGYVEAGGIGSTDIKEVTLDGVVVPHVFEFDDVRGWLRHYEEEPDGKLRVVGFYPKLFVRYRAGVVRAIRE